MPNTTNTETRSIININNTTYNIQDDLFEVIRKYFNVDSDDENAINLLKTSLFGYNLEMFSNEIKNNVYHRNIIYDEHFLNTASFPESIYNFAKMYNYNITMASPSHCKINFAVSKSDLLSNKYLETIDEEYGDVTVHRKSYKFVIDNSYIFSLDSIQFRLPYPVIITLRETSDKKDFSLTAYYDTSESNFPYLTLSNDYIKLWQDTVEGEKMVFLGLDLYQLEYSEKTINIVSEDIIDNLNYEINFTNQLAYFEVYYEYNGESELINSYFNNTYQPGGNEKFCYYTFNNDDTIILSFSSTAGSFRPKLNSTLKVKLYTTLGYKGNFSYIGNTISCNFNSKGEYDKMNVLIVPLTECTGGEDNPSYTSVKNGIINKFSTRNNLIIDNDLDVYFEEVNETDKVYNSSIKFIKKRNDVIKRLFTAYLLIRNKEKKVIPTNTAPTLVVSSTYLENNNYCIAEGTVILYDEAKEMFVIDENNIVEDNTTVKDGYLIYRSPFLLKVFNTPILLGNYFSTYINKDINLNFQYVNPHIDDSFLLIKMNLKREDYLFRISFNMESTFSSLESTDIIIRCILCNSNGLPYGFIDLDNMSDNTFYYEGILGLDNDNLISDDGKLVITQLYDVKGGAVNSSIIDNIPIDNNIKIELGILIKSEDSTYKSGNFANMTDISDYTTAVIYETEDTIEIFKNMYNYMESDVRTPVDIKNVLGEDEYYEKYLSDNYFFIKQFPLIENVYYQNAKNSFFEVWNIYLDIIKDSIDYLENNTSVDIKLQNTYGKSNFYYYNYSYNDNKEIEYDYLDNIHLNIDMNIYLNYYIDEETDKAIKEYISNFLESCNETQLVPISNLITSLETNFDIIKYIEFFKIGDNETQKIKSSFTSLLDLSKYEVEDYVPEYLNIEKKLDLTEKLYNDTIDENGDTIIVEDVDYNNTLIYPYNYDMHITYLY